MNVLIIGGSNSRLKNGYTATLRTTLESVGNGVDVFNNISLGANTCLLGIVSLLELQDDVDYDVVVLEYSVNDYSMTARKDYALWRASYEGLIRLVSKRWRKAKICCVLLGRSNVESVLWEKQIRETKLIADHYVNVMVADVQSYLPGQIDSGELYADPMHYSESAQFIAGSYVANRILEFDVNFDSSQINSLYTPVFDSVDMLDMSDSLGGNSREFSNSVVRFKALELSLNNPIEVSIPGQLICLVFISTSGVGSFRIDCDKETAVVHTLHDGVRDGKFEFLPLTAYSSWWDKDDGVRKLTFNAIRYCPSEADWPTYHVVPSKVENPVVYLSKILYRKPNN